MYNSKLFIIYTSSDLSKACLMAIWMSSMGNILLLG